MRPTLLHTLLLPIFSSQPWAESQKKVPTGLQQLGCSSLTQAASLALQSALRLKPTFTDAYNNMASALVQKGLIPQAVECYNAALQINPSLVSPGRDTAALAGCRIAAGRVVGAPLLL